MAESSDAQKAGLVGHRLRIMWMIVVVAALAGFYRLFVWPIQKLDRCYAVSVTGGVAFVDRNGHRVMQKLLTRDGKRVDSPVFAVHGSRLFYWSRVDSSLGVIDGPGGKPKWYTPHQDPSDLNSQVRRMSADGRFVAMDIGSRRSEQPVLLLNLRDGKWKRLAGVVQARLDPSGTGQIAMRTERKGFVIGSISGGTEPRTVSRIARVWDWDYSFDTKTLYVLESIDRSIVIQGSDGVIRRASLPATWHGLAVSWQSVTGELWIGGYGMCSAILRAPVLSGDGTYLGALHMFGPTFDMQAIDGGSEFFRR